MADISDQIKNDERDDEYLERKSGIRTHFIRVAPYLWPKGQSEIKYRVIFSMLALLLSKRNRGLYSSNLSRCC